MTSPPRAGRWDSLKLRIRLGLVLALALAPVLLLSGLQSALVFQRDAHDQRVDLVDAARRSAATARARIAGAEVLLRTLAPESSGVACARQLADLQPRAPGLANLIRFGADGWVICAAAPTPTESDRSAQPWFQSLASGRSRAAISEPTSGPPALWASVPAFGADGRFDGVLTAAISLSSLRPDKADRAAPAQSEVALADDKGDFLSATAPSAFPADIAAQLAGRARSHDALWLGPDRAGRTRLFASSPMVGQEVYVVVSTPSQGVVTWARLNPVSAFLLPLLAFALALGAVMVVTERAVVRWVVYLTRIAALYGAGRYSVRPVRAEAAAPEIRALASAMENMARTIAARDSALRDGLVHKDALMREIHHRVKNNLQVISSLLNMQQRALSDPSARAAMQDTRQRISALALIYRALYQGPDMSQVDLRDFLDELIAQLVMGDGIGGAPIRTELRLDPLVMDPDQLAPLALFAVEAITNAKKHGMREIGGILTVSFLVRDGRATLTISDSGAAAGSGEVGVGAGSGVGRTLMTAFARQLRGEVAFEPNLEGGLTVRLDFPISPAPAAPARPPALPADSALTAV